MPLFKRKQEKQKPMTPSSGAKGSATIKRTPSTRSNPQSPDSLNGDIGLPTSLLGSQEPGSSPQLVLSEEVLPAGLKEPAEAGTTPKSPMKTSSRLSKTLREVLHDKDAVHCFIEFMESRRAERYIRFWLDADSFRASTLTRMRSHSLRSVNSSSILKRRSEGTSKDSGSEAVDGETRLNVVGQPEVLSRTEGNTDGENPVTVSPPHEDVTSEGRSRSQIDESNCDRRVSESCATSCDSERTSQSDPDPVASRVVNASASEPTSDKDGRHNHVTVEETLPHSSKHPAGSHTPTADDTNSSATHHRQCAEHSRERASGGVASSECDDNSRLKTIQGALSSSSNANKESTKDECDTASVDTLTDCHDVEGRRGTNLSGSARDTEPPASDGSGGDSNQDASVSDSKSKDPAGNMTGSKADGGEAADRSQDDSSAPRQHRTASAEEIREKLKKSIERDAVSIYTKYIAQDAPQPIGVDDVLRGETIRKICREDGQVDPDCFVACQEFVVNYMEKEYHKAFSDSEHHCKHQVHVLTSDTVYLADILYNEHALCYFMEFMEQEDASHLMQFWMAADNFQQQLIQQQGSYDGMQAQNDAMVLYDRFFSLQATMPLGFDDKIRFEVESNICREEGPLPDCFSKPRDIILHNLEKVYFPRYLSSDIYFRYLSDLINTVRMSQDLPVRKHKRQASDTSSEHSAGSQSLGAESISFRNTLLASGSRTARKSTSSGSLSSSAGKIEEQLGTMDSDFLNPDKLWTQPRKGPLSLGKVNAYGQFVSEFDPDPDGEKKKGGFFKKKKDKEKEQEEMAIQVAQMILSDVAAMTQMGDACSRDDSSNTTSNFSADATAKSLSAPASAASFFEPPPS